MKTRIITSVIIVAIAIPAFLLSGYIVYPIILALLSALTAFELLRVFGYHKRPAVAIPSYLLAISMPIAAYFIASDYTVFFIVCAAALYAYLLYLFMVAVFSKGAIKFSRMAAVFCAIAYSALAFTSTSAIRYIENGVLCFGIIFICSWVSDVFALVVGVLFGKHKLIPEISPKKTVEGLIGGVVFATAAMLLYGFIIDLLVPDKTVNYLVLGVSGVLLSLISQLGDLVASTIKREEGVKDYGTLLPGHGGIMDRFDSILAVSVIALAVCIVFPPFA